MSDFAQFADPTARVPSGHQNVDIVQHGNDRGLFVEFSKEPRLMTFKSQQAGRPIYEDRDFISITYAGGKSVNKREVKLEQGNNGEPSDPERFPRQWEAFRRQAEQAQTGTPLEVVPWMTKSQVFELKAQKIYTVEALANVPDSALNISGGRGLRDKAQKYLSAADDGAAFSILEAKNKDLETDLEMLKEQVRLLSMNAAKVAAETETPKARAGSPTQRRGE